LSDKKIPTETADLAKAIDQNFGNMTRGEFIAALINYLITEKPKFKNNAQEEYATREEIVSFEQDMKLLMKSFLDFFVAFDPDLNKNDQLELEKFASKLHGLQKDLGSGNGNASKNTGTATIKWKP
jgi:uncharacterized protein YpmS